jgi:hypothetical protein
MRSGPPPLHPLPPGEENSLLNILLWNFDWRFIESIFNGSREVGYLQTRLAIVDLRMQIVDLKAEYLAVRNACSLNLQSTI